MAVDIRDVSVPYVAPQRLSWNAIWAGAFAGFGLALLLHTLGLAIGLTTVNPEVPRTLRGAAIGVGVWAFIVPIIAMFAAGIVGGRAAGVSTRAGALVHGTVIWAVATIATVAVLGLLSGSIIGTATRLGGAAIGAAGETLGGVARGGAAMRIDYDTMVGPINARLRAEGHPPITGAQLEAATNDVLGTAVTTGRIDREALVRSIETNTALSRAGAEEVASSVSADFERRRAAFSGQLQQAGEGALRAVDRSGVFFWGLFGSMVLSLAATLLGATLGLFGRRRRAYAGLREPVTTTPAPVTTP